MKTLDYKFFGKIEKLQFGIGNYLDNNNLYLGLYLNNGDCFSDISCNYGILGKNEIQLDDDFINICPGLLQRLLDEGILEDKNIYYKVNLDKVKEYKCLQF